MILPAALILDETASQDNARPVAASSMVSLVAAERALKDCLDTAMAGTLSWHESPQEGRIDAPHKAIKITTGVGKSEQIRRMIAEYIPEAKRRGLPHRVLYLVPTHSLGDEARKKMSDSVATALWQGRQAINIATGEPLCRDLEAVEAALTIGADVEETACRKGRRGGEPILCPFYETCGYQAQKQPAKAADVVFAAHEIGFQPPDTLGDGFGLVVIDEAFWQDGITDARLAISGLAQEMSAFPVRDVGGAVNAYDTAHLADLISRLQRALEAAPDGYIARSAITEAGLLPGDYYESGSCAQARKYEWRRKVDVGLRPGSGAAARQQALEQYQFLGQIRRRAAMWQALDELLAGDAEATGRLRIETVTTREGSIKWLHVLGRQDLHDKVAGLPLIHADATMQIDLVRHYLPRIETALDVDVDAPHMKITQVVGLPVGKASLQALDFGKRAEGEEARVSRKRQRLADFVRHQVRGRKGLVVTYKDVEADFREDGTEAAHFGAIEGIDRWRDVDVMVTIGRPLPRPKDIERYVAALTGEPIIVGGMMEAGAGISMTSGTDHLLKCRVYENSHAETVRRAVVEAAIIQAVGRVRGVRRGPHNPVEVFMVLHDTVTPMPVAEVVEFSSLEPSAIDEMILRGLVPQTPADAAKLFPDLFPTRPAAKMAYHRGRLNVERGSILVTSPYRELPIRACYQNRVRYRTAGRGQLSRLALYDPARFPDIRASLEAALGPLVAFEILPVVMPQQDKAQPVALPAEAVAPVLTGKNSEFSKTLNVVTWPEPARKPYQLDMFGAPVVDLYGYRGGKLSVDLRSTVKATYRARGQSQTQFASEIGLSQPQLCNALCGRFGLSAEAASRLRAYLGAG